MVVRFTLPLALLLAALPAHAHDKSAPVAVALPTAVPVPVDTPWPGGTIDLTIDASDTRRGLYRVTETIPVPAGTTELTLLYPDMGFIFFIKGFAAAVLGGLASVPGAIVGGILIGVSEQLAAGYIQTSLQEVAAFVVIMFVLIFIPNGLFGGKSVRDV